MSENVDIDEVNKLISSVEILKNQSDITGHDISSIIEDMNDILVTSIEKTFSSKDIPNPDTPKKKVNNKPWFGKKCRLARKKYHLARKIYSTRTPELNDKLRHESRNYKRVANKYFNIYKRNLQIKIQQRRQNEPKDYWKLINGVKKNDCRNDVHINELCEYFKTMNTADDTHDDFELPAEVHNDEINRPITVNEIRDVITNLKNK